MTQIARNIIGSRPTNGGGTSTGFVRNLHIAPRRETPDYPAGQTLAYWLGLAARQAREAAGVSMVQIAALLAMNTTKGIERFERAENWPLSLEWTLAAYGKALSIDGRLLLANAMRLWMRDGQAPTMSPVEAQQAAKEAAQRALVEEAEALAHKRVSDKARLRRGRGARRKTQEDA